MGNKGPLRSGDSGRIEPTPGSWCTIPGRAWEELIPFDNAKGCSIWSLSHKFHKVVTLLFFLLQLFSSSPRLDLWFALEIKSHYAEKEISSLFPRARWPDISRDWYTALCILLPPARILLQAHPPRKERLRHSGGDAATPAQAWMGQRVPSKVQARPCAKHTLLTTHEMRQSWLSSLDVPSHNEPQDTSTKDKNQTTVSQPNI